MPLTEFRDEVSKELSEFAWRQWSQMGVLSPPAQSDDRPADPEALLLLSLEVGRDDPRLYDEISDWLVTNRHRVRVQRLRNLCEEPADRVLVESLLSWISRFGVRAGKGAATGKPATTSDLEQFFRRTSLRVSEPDPSYADYGFLKPASAPSSRSQHPDLLTPINLAFRLRAILGNSVRSELIRVLLARPEVSMSVAELAFDTGYSKRNVLESADELVESGVLISNAGHGPARFRIFANRWEHFLNIDAPTVEYDPWPRYLSAYRKLLRWLWWASETDESDYLVTSSAIQLLGSLSPLELDLDQLPPRFFADDPEFFEQFRAFIEHSFRLLWSRQSERGL